MLQLNGNNKQKNPANNLIKKWAKELNRHFPEEDIELANRYMQRYSTSRIMRECKTKPHWYISSHLSEGYYKKKSK